MVSIVVKLQVSCLLLLNISYSLVNSYDVNGFCGNPGKPFNSRLEPDKERYAEGEEVTYQCNEYWNYLKTRRCIKGNWTGTPFRCGKTIENNDLNYIKVEDVSKELPEIFFEYNITLLPNYKFPNSFTSSRYPVVFKVESDRKIRWTLRLQNAISLPFFRIHYLFRNLTVEESQKVSLNVNAIVSPYRTCVLVNKRYNKIWKSGTKVEIFFECDANSPKDYLEDVKNPGNQIIIETQTSKDISYNLLALFLAEAYGSSDDPICGEPQKSFGQLLIILWPHRNYAIDCSDSMTYVSQTNPDLPGTTIHYQNCIYDMKWKGTYPKCKPKVICELPQENDINSIVKISHLKDVFYFNETQWYAIEGSKLKYECNDPQNQVLLGDATHRCRNGQWIGRAPNCFDLSEFKSKKIKNRAIHNDESQV